MAVLVYFYINIHDFCINLNQSADFVHVLQIGEKIIENLPALPSSFNFSSSVESLRQYQSNSAEFR